MTAVGHIIGLSLDRRQRVCRALTELYFCVERLGELADDIVRAIAQTRFQSELRFGGGEGS
jgi:hypothetical protein